MLHNTAGACITTESRRHLFVSFGSWLYISHPRKGKSAIQDQEERGGSRRSAKFSSQYPSRLEATPSHSVPSFLLPWHTT